MKTATISAILAELSETKQQLGYCPVTGILTSLGFPTIPSVLFEYPHPFSIESNWKTFPSLDYKIQWKTPKTIKAGLLLACLSHLELCEDRLSSVQRNLFLSLCSDKTLLESISLFCSISYEQTKVHAFPRLCLEIPPEQYCSENDVLSNFLSRAKEILFPIENLEPVKQNFVVFQSSESKHFPEQKQKKQSILSEERKEGKSLIVELTYKGILDDGFALKLLALFKGENLLTVSNETKDKIMAKLSGYENPECNRIRNIIKGYKTLKDIESLELSPIQPAAKKKTLAEILAEKMGTRA